MNREDYLLLSGLQHFAFCPRQWALIHIEQQWAENLLTVEGKFLHKNAHEGGTEKRGKRVITRGMPVISHTLGCKGYATWRSCTRTRPGCPSTG